MTAMQRAGPAAAWARDALFPPTCVLCRAPVGGPGLCGPCRREAPFVSGAACRVCALPLPGAVDAEASCDRCAHAPPPWEAGRAPLRYEGSARRLVLRLKHGDGMALGPVAAAWLHGRARGLVGPGWAVVPVPLHPRRLWRRRYNQAAEIARPLARLAGADYAPGLLRRVRAGPPQDRRTRAARAQNVAGAFAARDAAGRDVAVVDDVMASGATMAACADALRAGGARRVVALVLARAE